MEYAIEIEGISKRYGDVQALQQIDLRVGKGEIMGLIGPDGAGKSTLYRILTTLLLPDEGSASLNGYDIVKDYRHLRQILGYMPGRFSLYQDLTVEENLEFFATIFGTTIKENYHLIEEIYVQLEPFKDRQAGNLSGGMKQKLALCCALIHKPEILLLDEPTTGVDPVSRQEFWQMLKRLNTENITILVSTPYMDEAAMCDRVALIQSGEILTTSTPANIRTEYQGQLLSLKSQDMYHLLKTTRSLDGVMSCYSFGERLHVTIDPETSNLEMVQSALSTKGISKVEIKPIEAGVEDIFMQLLKRSDA
ncbi:MAG: ABC transporter ATP-binding protein [Flavobacteriales bacterium]|nr:ABC transporter ATP-binding protein [Flavobacteriales bacterium]